VEFATLWPLLAYAAAVVLLVGAMVALSWFLGERHGARATNEPYEGGIAPTGSTRQRLSVQFYLVAILFVVFDLEAVLLFAWAVAARDVGWAGYVAMVVFVLILGAALVYLWRIGALDWSDGRSTAPRDVRRPPLGRAA
jgi:NADH-quinone oxidoreductase subunit A